MCFRLQQSQFVTLDAWTNVTITIGVCSMFPGTYLSILLKIGSVTAEILLTLSLWWVGVQRHLHVKPNIGNIGLSCT